MEVLGYQLIKIDRTHYDASVLARYEKLEDIVLACAEKGLDIVFYNEGELILDHLNKKQFLELILNNIFSKADLGGFEPPTLGSEVPRHNPD